MGGLSFGIGDSSSQVGPEEGSTVLQAGFRRPAPGSTPIGIACNVTIRYQDCSKHGPSAALGARHANTAKRFLPVDTQAVASFDKRGPHLHDQGFAPLLLIATMRIHYAPSECHKSL
eukprot:2077195-Amphidinium_carterae.2